MSDERKTSGEGESPAQAERTEQAARGRAREETIAHEADRENTAHLLGEVRRVTAVMADDEAKKKISRHSRRTFLIGGAAALAAYGGLRWLKAQPEVDGIPAPFRASHEFNRRLSEAYLSETRLAREFPRSRVGQLRVNGGEGMSGGFDPAKWRLQVVGVSNPQQHSRYTPNIAYETAMDNMNAGHDSSERHENPDAKIAPGTPPPNTMDRSPAMEMQMPGLLLTMDDIRQLPRVEMTTELKCIEGWSTIVHWAGTRFRDFAAQFQPPTRNNSQPDVLNRPQDLVRYVSLVTPDGGYYVGMDMASALHPQTLLCYEMNDLPLTVEHGAPLRLVTPLKYGIKHIKRVGRITFTDTRPADFWGERGYDWYSGH